VIEDAQFTDAVLMDRRRRDHERIDRILASRVAAEDTAIGGRRSAVDRLLKPLNRLSSRRFLREARQKVWVNLAQLQVARVQGQAAYATRLGELELLSAAKISDLLAPGQVLLRLAATGFGVTLPPP
jgi:predicted aminopeptidase